ncbi:MAG: hypothetical protein ACRD2Y_11035, partial [Terriglobales bacterium]
LLAFLLFGQLVATTHEYAVRHAACPRHGELIDVESRGWFSASGPTSAQTSTQASTPDEEGSQTRHQHCLFVSSRGDQKNFRLVGPAASTVSAATHWAPSASADAPRPALTLYLTAPKHSPPTA